MRPDITFKKAGATADDADVPVLLDGCSNLDVAVISPSYSALVSGSLPHHGKHAYWAQKVSEKKDKHSGPSGACLPVVVATSGAIDPGALRWMQEQRKNMPLESRVAMRCIVRGVAFKQWTIHGHMDRKYREMSSHGANDAVAQSAPTRGPSSLSFVPLSVSLSMNSSSMSMSANSSSPTPSGGTH